MITLNDIFQGNPGAYAIIQEVLRRFSITEAELIFQEMLHRGYTGENLWVFYKDTHQESLRNMIFDLGFGALWRG